MRNYIIHYDNLTVNDPDFKQRVQDITEFYVYPPDGFKLLRTHRLTQTLRELSNSICNDVEWVFVNSLGHGVDVPDFYYRAIAQCDEQKSPLMAHILHNSERYPYMAEQCFLINLQVYKQVGCPSFELDTLTVDYDLIRSEENIHDNYTPLWVGPKTTQTKVNLQGFGNRVIRAFAKAGHRIINFDNDLRQFKWNLYPNENYDKVQSFFNTGTYGSNLIPDIFKRIQVEKESLDTTTYILNSEPVGYYSRVHKPIDHYIVLAGGFKPALLINKYGYHSDTKITCIDISKAGHEFQNYIREHWDGDLSTYHDLVFKQFDKGQYRLAWRSWNTWESEIESFLSESKLSREQFKQVWEVYRNIPFNHMPMDLLGDVSPLVNLINSDQGKNLYVWFSNAFNMQWTQFILGKQYTNNHLNELLKNFKESKNNITVEHSNQYNVYNYSP